jgi:hypothetical protein
MLKYPLGVKKSSGALRAEAAIICAACSRRCRSCSRISRYGIVRWLGGGVADGSPKFALLA